MSFSYSINTGLIANDPYAFGSTSNYLKDVFSLESGYTGSALTSGLFLNVGSFSSQYQNLYGKTLNISDGYKFFESGNEIQFENILDGTGILNYTSKTPVTYYDPNNISRNPYDSVTNNMPLTDDYTSIVDRQSVYKEMFLEIMGINAGAGASSTLNITTSTYSSAYDEGDGTGKFGDGNLANISTWDTSEVMRLYDQLTAEATTLSTMINGTTLDYGGYPEIPYETNDPEIELLEKQLEVANQQFLKVYDDFFGYYKIKAGEHTLDKDTDTGTTTAQYREKEAATAAMMTATIALNYAQQYYSQPIKPEGADYTFGQAPVVFKGTNATTQDDALSGDLSNYMADPAAFSSSFLSFFTGGIGEGNNSTGYVSQNIIYSNEEDESIFDMSMSGGGYNSGTLDSTGANYKLGTEQLDELGDSPDEYINWMVRDAFGVGGITADVKDTAYCGEITYLAKDIIAAAQKMVDLKMQIMTKTAEASINNKIRAEYEARLGAIEAIESFLTCPDGTDPYTVTIDGQKYLLGQDLNDNNTIDNLSEILGIKDTQDNMFESLKKLDTNNDGYVSQEELKTGKIILNAINEKGALTASGYDTNLVQGINLASLQNTDGTYGKFTMDLQNGTADGDLTFENSDYFNTLFGIDFSSKKALTTGTATTASPWTWGNITNANQTTKSTTESTEKTTPETVSMEEAATEDVPEFSIDDSGSFSFDFSDATDSKSPIEQLLEQICWKMRISNLSSSQKMDIVDNIDAGQDLDVAEYEIRQDLESLNMSA